VQELLGYKPHFAIGVVDVGSPMALLKIAGDASRNRHAGVDQRTAHGSV
jgi:hypothetical protein